MRAIGLGAALAALTLLSSACHTMSFDVADGPAGKIVYERKSFYFWGLTPTHNVDVLQHCPDGAVTISEETTPVDVLYGALTLGIWSPRSSYYHCAAGVP